MTDFGKVITAMITPFDADNRINYAVTEKLVAHLATQGSDAIVVCGTTGESPTLTWDEEYELFQVVKKTVGGKVKIIAGTGSNSTKEAIEATQKAAKLGLDGSLQVSPYYNKPPQAGLFQHFQKIAESCPDLPMMLYNIPGRTGVNILPETIAKLAEIPNIVAVKEASGNIDQVSQIRQLTNPEFAIYSGDDSLTLPMLAIGAQGVVSVASHLVGNQMQQMIQSFAQGDVKKATQIHLELLDLFKVLFITTNPIPVKTALKLQGWEVGSLRLPLCDLGAEMEQKIKDVLVSLKLL